MNRPFSRLLAVCTLLILLLSSCGAPPPSAPNDGRLRVVATIFPAYDFARAVCGDAAEVTLLLPPGAESHSYEPTPADILAVGDSDLFFYLGGESDAWVETLLSAQDGAVERMKMMDCVELKEEAELEGMTARESHAHGEVLEYDEHVWTSPANAADITAALGERMAALDPAGAETYRANAAAYSAEIMALDREFRDFFAARPRTTLVFGDRFPLRYFAEEYGLECYAAFPGCSTQTEPSAATVASLTDRVRDRGLGTVYYIEFSNHLVADGIAEAAGAETALFHSCHNVSRADLDAGATYVTLMRHNLETLGATLPAPS